MPHAASCLSDCVKKEQIKVEYRKGEKQAVNTVEDTSVAGDDVRAVLDLGSTFQQ